MSEKTPYDLEQDAWTKFKDTQDLEERKKIAEEIQQHRSVQGKQPYPFKFDQGDNKAKYAPTKFKLETMQAIKEATKSYVEEILKDCETETEKASVDCKIQLYESIFKSISGNFRP